MRFVWRRLGLFSARHNYMAFFCIGLLTGILVMNIGKSILLEETGLFDEDTLYHMKYMTVDGNALFCYILRKRISKLLILAVISTTYLGVAACMGTVFWYGMSVGTFLTSLAIRYGIKGILLAVVSVLPQYLLYIPSMLALLVWCDTIFSSIYNRSGGGVEVLDRGFWLKKAGQLAVIIFVTSFGCLLEGYINPYLLLGFLKIF